MVKMGWKFGEEREIRNTENSHVNKIRIALG
jgi:hypothetical protein